MWNVSAMLACRLSLSFMSAEIAQISAITIIHIIGIIFNVQRRVYFFYQFSLQNFRIFMLSRRLEEQQQIRPAIHNDS